ncbi:MAG: flagellar basal-body rod protein FlgG [Bdellovibrionales bacterium]|nr:flagellar basal-body rod protein FlgG [Bdellovibrionales bacterium]MBT3525567.1 flagellar basal-body rod protein FlgG [Bdellovibrionales bacterium]MBT7670267.1 flagellar basal-body rod protein FlgG [Bdellovibrionales bacterium]MBT7767346.1 flagellar basal-body rod protein FlgG [Bdellovibrionales bacterium]
MLRALNTAATGMTAQEANVNTISNNIANVNTIGFKKGRAEFEDLLYETIRNPGSRSSATTRYNVGTQIGSGATISAVRKSFGQGSPQITQNPFDLMINGDGFFAIIMPNNQLRYSRDGAFNVDNQGTLVTQNGYKVFPGITLPPNTKNVVVSENGNMDVYISNQVQPSMVGTIPLFTFANPVGLKSAGGNLYLMTESSGQAMQSVAGQGHVGTIMQGALESSNVSIMTEMTSLIKAQRAYEMNSKVMGVADQMLQTVNSIR